MKELLSKKQKGITLIALVITIIVLLILAGVALSAITGNESAMNKATQARTENDRGAARDAASIMATGYIQEYMTKKYTQGDTSVGSQTTGQYVASQMNNKTSGEFTFTTDESTLTVSKGGNAIVTGTIEDNGTITWDANINENESGNGGNNQGGNNDGSGNEQGNNNNQGGNETPTDPEPQTPSTPTVANSKPADSSTPVQSLNAKTGQSGTVKVKDEFNNEIPVPAGFGIAYDSGASIKDGIVIEDASTNNQFVWIPVGEFKVSAEETKTVTLGRYSDNINSTNAYVASSGEYIPTKTDSDNMTRGSYNYSESDASVANFVTSARNNKGYYIARYEAGVAGTENENITDYTEETYTINGTTFTKNDSTQANKLTSKSGMAVWNKITRKNAKTVCEGMYSGHSALMNSYAWDTAIIFIQQCSGTANYYAYIEGNGSIKRTGAEVSRETSSGTLTADERCHIRGMASNMLEWSTESASGTILPCVYRGGFYFDTNNYTANRSSLLDTADYIIGFRPLYYL